jgi:hypothetical protein
MRSRPTGWFRVLLIVLLQASAALMLVASVGNACKCNCYLSDDCFPFRYCRYSSCLRWYNGGKLKDGLCT